MSRACFRLVALVLTVIGLASASQALAFDGQDDPSFGERGDHGVAREGLLGDSSAFDDMLVLGDGRIVTEGYAFLDPNAVIARLTAAGRSDPTWGVRGISRAALARGQAQPRLAPGPSGTLYVGSARPAHGREDDPIVHLAVSRLRADGSRDPTFAGGGTDVDTPGEGERGGAVAAMSDGGVAVGGRVAIGAGHGFGVARLRRDGTLETSFGQNGIASAPLPLADAEITDLVVDSAGRLLAAGYGKDPAGPWRTAVVRFTADGHPDGSFAGGGRVLPRPERGEDAPQGAQLALQPGAAGTGRADARLLVATVDSVARLLDDGSLDRSFGVAGNAVMGARSMVVLPNREIVVGASTLQRLTPDGRRDTSFGIAGSTRPGSLHTQSGNTSPAAALGLQGGSGLIVGADTTDSSDGQWSWSRVRLNCVPVLGCATVARTGRRSALVIANPSRSLTARLEVARMTRGRTRALGSVSLPRLPPGPVQRRWDLRLHGRTLAPGRYRLVVAGGGSRSRPIPLTVPR